MAGGGRSQKNKEHKTGKHQSKGQRHKHREQKQGGHIIGVEARSAPAAGAGKLQRALQAKQARDAKRAELVGKRRAQWAAPPTVVCFLPLSGDVDIDATWELLTGAAARFGPAGTGAPTSKRPWAATLQLGRQTLRALFAPPLFPLRPLDAVEVARAADVVLALVPSHAGAEAVDGAGRAACAILASMGLPGIVCVAARAVTGPGPAAGDLKGRSAAKKRASQAVESCLSGGHKAHMLESDADADQLLRHLASMPSTLPLWRQQRPCLVAPSVGVAASGEVYLEGHVRILGMSAQRSLHVCGMGDVAVSRICAAREPKHGWGGRCAAEGEADKDTGGGAGMEVEAPASGEVVLSQAGPSDREPLTRENVPDTLAGEQTWPTEEEMREAEVDAAAARHGGGGKRGRLGVSDYQAAWIDEDDEWGSGEEEGGSEGEGDDEAMSGDGRGAGGAGTAHDGTDGDDAWMGAEGDDDNDGDNDNDMNEEGRGDYLAALQRHKDEARRARGEAAEGEEEAHPDEIDLPPDVPGRIRLQKYRGLKSFRLSPWDARESLPREYARVFAFTSFRRTMRKALESARSVGVDAEGVPPNAYVRVYLDGLSSIQISSIRARVDAFASGSAPPLCVFGNLQHECKLSVANYAVTKRGDYHAPIKNKDPLLFVSGHRSFPARPIFSTDEHGADKHKMERYLQHGRPAVATVYAPICYPPVPLLVFESHAGSPPALAASGHLQSCDPDRVVVKRAVLTGVPMRSHKAKAVVKYMFHNPEDVRWFRPVQLHTKMGRHGRIREPVGTHGLMKCIFDGPVHQHDTVCMALYKRVFPKWPQDLAFA